MSDLIAPLKTMLDAADGLRQDVDDALNTVQSRVVEAIHRTAKDLYETVISIPDVTWEKARKRLDYEARSHLASIIGYAEVLLEQNDGAINDDQRIHLQRIRAAGLDVIRQLAPDEHPLRPISRRILTILGQLLAPDAPPLTREAREDADLMLDSAQRLDHTITQIPHGEMLLHAQHEEIVHRLLMLVNTVLGFSRLMLKGLDGMLDPQQEHWIEQIQGDSLQIKDYLYDLFDIAPVPGDPPSYPQHFDARKLFARLQGVRLLKDTTLRLRTEITSPPLIYADRANTRAALEGLIRAVAQMQQDGEIVLGAHPVERDMVEFYVRFVGKGVDYKEADFVPVHQALGRMGAQLEVGEQMFRFLLPASS